MAIECVHIYSYSANQTFTDGLDLPLRDYSKSQLAITNIEGVAPVSANVNITQYAARDGGVFNSSRRAERHITITMKLFSDPSMDAVRQKVYNTAPVGQPITLVFDWTDGVSKAIDGYVEDTPADYFGDQEGIQISVVCPDPDFRVVKKQEDEYKTVVNYKQFNYPNKTTIVDSGEDLSIEWVDPCKDETELYTIDSMFNIKNNTNQRQKYLFAIAFLSGWKELFINFYSSKFQFLRKSVNEYISGLIEAVWEEGKYYIVSDSGYKEVETELEFNYLTQSFNVLTAVAQWEANKYYAKTDAPETGKWISVTWNAQYADEEDPDAFPYRVTYGFLTDYKNGGEIVNSIVATFDAYATQFTPAAKAFSILSKSGTNLAELVPFVANEFYRKGRTYSRIGTYNGWSLVQAPYSLEDPTHDGEYSYVDDIIYFYEDYPDLYKTDGYFGDVPLYGFYRTVNQYVVMGTVYRANSYYYIDSTTGNEVLLVSNTAPSDWTSAVKKYYYKTDVFYEMSNYEDSTKLYGRYIYDLMLDNLTYKYVPITEQFAYESGKYYSYVGIADVQLKGLYGFTQIPIYKKVEGEAPSDWGTSGVYFERVRMTDSELTDLPGKRLYFNDHVYSSIKNRAVIEYIPLQEEPDDWSTNYSNYYTVSSDYSNIIAYFTPDEYPNYSKMFELTTEEPADFEENYSNYYICTKDYSSLLEKTDSYEANVIPSSSDNLNAIVSLMKKEDGSTNFLLGDVNGNIERYVYKKSSDLYYAGGYYIFDPDTQGYVVLSSNTMPEDFYTAPYKYYKKEVTKCDYIPAMTIIFYNPSTKRLEYDMNQYDLFINDFESWADHAMSPVISFKTSETGNRKNIRKDNFITYFVSGETFITGNIELDPGNNYILSETFYSNSQLSYDHARVIGIASEIA